MSPLSSLDLPFGRPPAPIDQAWGTARGRLERLSEQAGDSGLSEAQLARVRKSAEDFEAVFLGQMLAPMFESLETDGLFGGGSGERMYRSLLVEEYGKALARNGGVGIADAVTRQLLAQQEISP